MILAIDPGPERSAYVVWSDRRVVDSGWIDNFDVRVRVSYYARERQRIAIEMIASYGMAVGASVFNTCVEIGRMVEVAKAHGVDAELIFRKDVKLHVCGSPRAKDANIRQALMDSYGPVGTKKQPGPLYGVKSHVWAALAVAVTAEAAIVAGPSA
jgi:hypothetical protein